VSWVWWRASRVRGGRSPRSPVTPTTCPTWSGRDFTADAPALKLVGDITYIRTWEGWLYLSTVLDCFSKKVVGYAMAEHMRTELVADALRMAARTVPFRHGGGGGLRGRDRVGCGERRQPRHRWRRVLRWAATPLAATLRPSSPC